MNTDLTRRSFMKLTAAAGVATALGATAVNNLVETEKAYAEDEVKQLGSFCKGCILGCQVIATVRNGRVVRLEGNQDNPYNRGRLCPKGLCGVNALYHPNRTKYPMRRVGERGVDNKWERISWEEGITQVAEALIEMRDKTGRNGLLATSGGGGNPQFNDPLAFRSYWGGGNCFEPGAAQCAMPRDWIMSMMFGGRPTFPSIADGQARELYNPAYNCECYVIWGTGPAQSGPAQPGRCCVELREHGTKTIVVDPRFTADSARADIWLPIRPGTDVAMMLAWLNHILSNDLYNKEFMEKWSNFPHLVDPRDPAGALLRSSEVKGMADGTSYVYFDTAKNAVCKTFALSPENEGEYQPSLWGEYEVELNDGTKLTCKTAGQAYKDSVAEWTIEKAAEICWVNADDIKKAIEMYASANSGGVSLGVATDHHPQSTQAGEGACALNLIMGFIEKPGCPISTMPKMPSKYEMQAPVREFFSALGPNMRQQLQVNERSTNGYIYETDESVAEWLGYTEHKGLGYWRQSHIPTVHNAVMTGEPYQPRVWIERSGNKMTNLADSSSWVDAFKKFDLIVHSYMYPTSFTFEAADIIFPITEWLESAYSATVCNYGGFHSNVTLLFEHCDDRFTWGTIMQKLADLGDPNAYNCIYVDNAYHTQSTFQEYLKELTPVGMTWEEAQAINPWKNCEEDEFWAAMKYEENYLALDEEDGTYTGFNPDFTDAADIQVSPKKLSIYNDKVVYIGRHGQEKFELPPASVDYQPVPYYEEPSESPLTDTDYPLVLTEGRIPYVQHGTMRNIPYIREIYPAPEVWIDPDAAAERGIETGDWVNVKSRRCEESEYIKDGIFGVAYVTPGICHGVVYMERWWNPEFLEEGQDARKSWTLCNMNVLSKKAEPWNPECGTYTLRGFQVEVTKAERPEGIWYEPEDFAPWLPQPSDNTGGGYR
ncbi:molybdopterin-dependent oxidoreductase [uncultured Adlercreutzia sp.]|uniref:molybdopterin-dependent oxidoreductase n=1 Tax=uncultured Adlercreutzia sp. TaxID=875803 RepID=UPI0025F3F51D|nr:molybdopterin-dependent oxidoreductase [uncultured Adlercreutzia sp.]